MRNTFVEYVKSTIGDSLVEYHGGFGFIGVFASCLRNKQLEWC